MAPVTHVAQRINLWFARKSVRKAVGDALAYGIGIVLSAAAVIPLLWMLSTALKDMGSVFIFPPQWIPDPIVWENFGEAMTFFPFGLYYLNTCKITFTCIVGQLLTGSLVAYGFARFKVPGRDLLFMIVLSPMFLPFQVTLIPLYLLYNKLGWQDTYLPLTVPFFFGGSPFYIFLLRQFFRTIPNELDEAALIDGCSRLGILYRIILPLSKPALATVAIFSFMAHWNAFLMPLIYIDSQDKLTVALGLSRFTGMFGETLWNLLMAASLVAVLPCILVFLFAQKYFVQGIVTTGMTGR
jgi:ABC-type glycerol-3-phosphate transport system permease component